MELYEKLWDAAERNDVIVVKRLLCEIDDVDLKNERGWNAIMIAAYNQSREVVELLLNNGANINSQNENGTSVFMFGKTKSLNTCKYDFLDFLITQGADINTLDKKRGWSVLQYVEEAGDMEMALFLKNNGAK